MPDDAPWPEPVVIPDDLRELQADVDAYHREMRVAARRRRLARVTGTRTWQRFAFPLGVVIGSLAVAAGVLGILTLGQPRPTAALPRGPLATNPAAAVGQPNGLLPDATLVDTLGRSRAIRDLRPALVALVPLHCECFPLLQELAAQADEVHIRLVVVAPGDIDAELSILPSQMHRGRVLPVFDRGGLLAAAYSAKGVTTLVVRPDGTVGYIQYDVQASTRHGLEGALGQLLLPATSLSSG